MSYNKIEITEVENPGNTIFHQVEDYLNQLYDLRQNVISLDIEIKPKEGNKWVSCNENTLFIQIQKNNIKVSMNNLLAILKSDYVKKYNPLIEYYKSLSAWDGETDYIEQYAEYIHLALGESKEQFVYHFKKWCVRVVKCALIDGYFNKQAFILTDNGNGQNIGKSSWCRYLCPPVLKDYIAEDLSNNDKDSRILLCKNLLINLEELEALSRKEINQIKAILSKEQINERLPYDRKSSVIQRVASFMGSTNKTTFLQDETGSVRWLCFVVEKIDWSYKKSFNIDNLWAQAYNLSNDEFFDETMTSDDIVKNEIRNKKFQDLSQENQYLIKLFSKPDSEEEGEFMQPVEIISYISNIYKVTKLSPNMMGGRALKNEGYKRVKKVSKGISVYGYNVKKEYNRF